MSTAPPKLDLLCRIAMAAAEAAPVDYDGRDRCWERIKAGLDKENPTHMTKGQKIITLLKEVNSDSYWGLAINQVVNIEGGGKIVDLIIELRSQTRDNPPVMEKILGSELTAEIMSI